MVVFKIRRNGMASGARKLLTSTEMEMRARRARQPTGRATVPVLTSTMYNGEPDRLRRSFNAFILILRPNLTFLLVKFGRKMYNYKDTLMTARFLRTEMDKQPLRHILNTRLQVSI